MSTQLDYSQTPERVLLELINIDNGTALTPETVSFSEPAPVIDGLRNTMITVNATEESPFFPSSVNMFYNRIPLAAMGVLEFLSENVFTSDSLLAAINAKKHAYLYLSDLEDLDLNPDVVLGDIQDFNLTAKTTAIRWLGQVPISILFGLPENISELERLFTVILPAEVYL